MKLIPNILLFLLSFCAIAQEAEVVIISAAGNEESRKVLATEDGYFLIGVSDAVDASGSHIVIQKLSLSLTCIWSKKILLTQANTLADAVWDENGFLFITGTSYQDGDYNAYIAKFDQEGQLLDIGFYGSNVWDGANSIILQNDLITISGWTYNHPLGLKSAFVVQVSASLQWQQTFNFENEILPTEIVDASIDVDGKIFFLGNRGEEINNNLWFATIENNMLVTVLVDANYSNWFAASIYFDNGEWLVGCNRHNPNGDWDWMLLRYNNVWTDVCNYDLSTPFDYHVIDVLGGDRTFMIGYQYEFGLGQGDVMLQQIEEDCSWVAAMSFGESQVDKAASAMYDPQGRVVIAATRERSNGTTDMVLIRWNLLDLLVDYTFSTDQISCSTVVGLSDEFDNEKQPVFIHEGFLFSSEASTFEVYDIMGKHVKSLSIPNNRFDLRDLTSGVYLVINNSSGNLYKLFK